MKCDCEKGGHHFHRCTECGDLTAGYKYEKKWVCYICEECSKQPEYQPDGYGFDGINNDIYEILEETLFDIRKEAEDAISDAKK